MTRTIPIARINGNTLMDSEGVSKYEKAGLGGLIKLFHFHFIPIESKSLTHFKKYSFKSKCGILISMLLAITQFALCSSILANAFVQQPIAIHNVATALSMVSFTFGAPTMIQHTLRKLKQFHDLIHDIANCINNIRPTKVRRLAVRRVRKCVKVNVIFIIFTTFITWLAVALGIIRKYGNNKFLNSYFKVDEHYALSISSILTLITVWSIISNSLAVSRVYFVVMFSQIMTICFEAYLPSQAIDGHKQSVGQRMVAHRSLSRLVDKADKLLASTSLGYLMCVIVLLISYATVTISNQTGQWSVTVSTALLFISIQTITYILQTISASRLNEQELINYILYQNYQLQKCAQLTYAHIFPIKTDFIFTVGSLIITYLLVVKQFELE